MQSRTCNRSGNNGSEGAQLNQAVRPGQTFFGKDFGKHAELRGAIARALNSSQKQCRQHDRKASDRHARDGDGHNQNLREFRAQDNGPFAIAIGKITACGREQHKRRGKKKTGKREQKLARGFTVDGHVGDIGKDNPPVGVVAERLLKLRSPDTPESAAPILVCLYLCNAGRMCAHKCCSFPFNGCHDKASATAETGTT